MDQKPILVATHPRACSTAFERVFMTRYDTLTCFHEPFGEPWYFGPESMSERYQNDEAGRTRGGYNNQTYQAVLDEFRNESAEGKRLFIKDMAYYFMPPKGKPASIAPSLAKGSGIEAHRAIEDEPNANGTARHNELPAVSEPENPTVIPTVILAQFHFTFLIRHPRSSIPSYYRCTIPPLDEKTGFYTFLPSEAGYDELRRLFDYLRFTGQIGPDVAGQQKKSSSEGSASEPGAHQQICVVDADDLLDNPNGIIEAYCRSVGIKYDPEMLNWNKEDDEYATNMFASWSGFHDDALNSSSLKPRLHKKIFKNVDDENAEWCMKYGDTAAKVIRETVNANIKDYEYLKQFALQV
ncbi:helicase [Ptychographa xylographoides]|nr:helicase [Ptychographa xylographoides]